MSKVLSVSTAAAPIAIFRSYALVIVAILVTLVGVLWVLADDKRTDRLVRVIQAISLHQYAAASNDVPAGCIHSVIGNGSGQTIKDQARSGASF